MWHIGPIELSVSLGNLFTIGLIIEAIRRFERRHLTRDIEHEMLIGWFCEVHKKRVSDLPTRRGNL